MQIHAIVILALATSMLIGGLAWLFYSNLRIRWPKGERRRFNSGPYITHVVYAPGTYFNVEFANAAAKATWAAASAWMQARKDGRVKKDDSPMGEVIVYVETADAMLAKAKSWGYKSIAGYIERWKPKRWGSDFLPMAVISELHQAEVIRTGEPIIHEWMHALERDYVSGTDDHSNPVVWTAAAFRDGLAITPIQEHAGRLYVTGS